MLRVTRLDHLCERQGGSHWLLNSLRLDFVDSELDIQPTPVDNRMLRRYQCKIDKLVSGQILNIQLATNVHEIIDNPEKNVDIVAASLSSSLKP